MKFLKKYYILSVFFFVYLSAVSQQVAVISKIDTNSILIGDQINYTITVNVPTNYGVNFPVFTDKLSDNIDIVAQYNIDSNYSQDKRIIALSKRVIITSFDSGSFVIPSFAVQFIKPSDTNIYEMYSDSLLLNVNTLAVDTNLAIRDIKAPLNAYFTFADFLPYIIGGLAFIAIVILSVYFYQKYKRKKNNIVQIKKPKIPPYKKALQDFESLRQKKLWQNDRIKEYHSELTDILRIYFENQLKIQALEKTTDEILEAFEKQNSDKRLYQMLSGILTLADLVKFAKQSPLPDQHDLSLQNAIEIVNITSQNTKNEIISDDAININTK